MFKSYDRELSKLLDQVENQEIQIPDFQRGWVWDNDRIKALLASLTKGYPIGAIMLLESGGEFHFKCRLIGNDDHSTPPSIEPSEMILDGQQRTTSMFLSMRSKAPVKTYQLTNRRKSIYRYYYLDIKKALDPTLDRLDAIVSVDEHKQKRANIGRNIILDLSTPDLEFKNQMIPFNILSSSAETSAWRNAYQEYYNYDSEIIKEYQKLDVEVIQPLLNGYRVPIIHIEKDTPKEAICQVFENVNQGGMALTVFELITATFAADSFDLRADWDKIYQQEFDVSKHRILRVVDNTSFLTALTLLAAYRNHRTISCKRRDVLSLTLNDYLACRDQLVEGYRRLYEFLTELCLYRETDVPYATQFIPLAAICAVLGKRLDNAAVKAKIKQWYWCGILGELYGGANDSRYANDLRQVLEWVDGSSTLPNTINDFSFSTMRLLSLQTRLSAAYKGIMTLVVENGAKDWMTHRAIDFTNFIDEDTDIHHIFPKNYCIEQHYDKEKWNSVINKTPLFARTNRHIGGVAPSAYIAKLQKDLGSNFDSQKFIDAFESHLINYHDLSTDNFDAFIASRATKLLDAITDATGKPIADRDSEQVIATFGHAL